jgi:predicted nucleotidyltransferase
MASVKPVADKSDIFRRVRDSGKTLTSLGVLSVTLFGSFVRGKQTEQSDVDMLVDFSADGYTFDNFMEVSFLLESLLGRRVEIVTPDSLSPHFKVSILKEAERIDVAA